MQRLDYRIARSSYFDSIHRLNYQTFVDEIMYGYANASTGLVPEQMETYSADAGTFRRHGFVAETALRGRISRM